MISLNQLSVGYTHALIKDISQQVSNPSLIALTGDNGCGKSTLMQTMCGLLPPINGSVILGGKSIQETSIAERALKITMNSLSIDRHIMINVREFIALGRIPYTGLMGRLSIKDQAVINEYMDMLGLKQIENKAIRKISEGEFQRVQLAKCLVQETPVLLLDEPTAFMDMKNKEFTFRFLSQTAQQKRMIILVATHDIHFANPFINDRWEINNTSLYTRQPLETL